MKQIEDALELSLKSLHDRAWKNREPIELALKSLRAAKPDTQELGEALDALESNKTVTDIHTGDEIIPVDVEVLHQAALSWQKAWE